MKPYAAFLCACLVLTAMPARSETMYITEDISVMVRTGPGDDRRIIAMPTTGTAVEVVEAVDDWTVVRLSNGKEGWMMSRYLTKDPPARAIVDKLKADNENLRKKVDRLTEENSRLEKERTALDEALGEQRKAAESLRTTYKELKDGASEYMALKASYEKKSKELEEKNRLQAELNERLGRLEDTQSMRWFLGGAGVLFVGVLVGIMARRHKRKSSLV